MVNSDWFKRFVCYALSFHLAVGPVFSLPITVDPTQDQTYVDSAVNDVPIVYISAPDDNGLSQNKFTDYNVGSDGVIINNSVVDGTSQLAGYILGNDNFSDATAERILFDVTGKNISRLEGIQEIFGSSATFMLSNPNGLYINGYGFINTNRVRLTTGVPSWSNNQLQFDVESGDITIGGDGLNGSLASAVDILATAINIQGTVFSGGELNLVAGKYTYNTDTDTYTKIGDSESTEIAIDISGNLQGSSLQLITTESGSGVNSTGVLVSTADDIIISADGDIQLATVYSSNDLMVTTGDDVSIESGSVVALSEASFDVGDFAIDHASALGAVDLSIVADDIDNDGLIYSTNDLAIDATTLTNSGTRGDDLDDFSAGIQSYGDAQINVETLDNVDGLIVGNSSVVVADDIDNSGGQWVSYGDLQLDSVVINNTGGRFEMNGTGDFDGDITNTNGFIYSASDLALDWVDNTSGIIMAGSDITIESSDTFFNVNGELVSTQGGIQINANTLDNEGGQIVASQNIRMGQLTDAWVDGLVFAMDTVFVTANSVVVNGSIFGNEGVAVVTQSDDDDSMVINSGALVASNGTTMVTANGGIHNFGLLFADHHLDIYSNTSINNYNQFLSFGTMDIALDSSGDSINNDQGNIQSMGDLMISGPEFNNVSDIETNTDYYNTSVSVKQLKNDSNQKISKLKWKQTIDIESSEFATVQSNGSIYINDVGTFNNDYGNVIAEGDIYKIDANVNNENKKFYKRYNKYILGRKKDGTGTKWGGVWGKVGIVKRNKNIKMLLSMMGIIYKKVAVILVIFDQMERYICLVVRLPMVNLLMNYLMHQSCYRI